MFKKVKSGHWLAVALGLTLLGGLPLAASAQEIGSEPADQLTVVRDGATGKLRAPTSEELQTLHKSGARNRMRASPAPTLQKFHPNGAVGVRLNDEFMTQAVVTRTADGKLVKQCLEPGHNGQAPHPAHTILQPVTE
ncbi:post-PEP-CTERM-1 domain-containing protein [Massilia horti]|uniref:Secreted protein n=1 Tax=Massilia horti TaxID=2562153 RepID=A0A4Y9T9B5_9BURK|nr:hypothetical protein [Massilia horti]TFW34555.1 hypothetical protein E4O92_03775 [Massilia horti]